MMGFTGFTHPPSHQKIKEPRKDEIAEGYGVKVQAVYFVLAQLARGTLLSKTIVRFLEAKHFPPPK